MRNRLYYLVKPYIPRRARIALRRLAARRALRDSAEVWPILEAAGSKPPGWPGWPDGAEFAVVLSHDVEGARGVARVKEVAELEMSLGFRSSFNFIPEGTYNVSKELRDWLTSRGFEVGVHDLHHDGKLYHSRAHFRRCADRINHYLQEWGAVGFRSGFMLRNFEWIHDLNIEYDASSFDTDPFEPQPDGVDTIFPFWVPAPPNGAANGSSGLHGFHSPAERNGGFKPRGYVELPYTLVQDLNLFVVLREKSIDIWKRKVDWIAAKGGMVHLDTHPDYLVSNASRRAPDEVDMAHYRNVLLYLREKFGSRYWHALPRHIAAFARQNRPLLVSREMSAPIPDRAPGVAATVEPAVPVPVKTKDAKGRRTIWIDLDNTPHVPFFAPMIGELESRGYRVVLTARDAFQVAEMADLKGLRYHRVGRHYGKNRFAKLAGLLVRAFQLAPFAFKERPTLALSHGARSQIILCNLLRIPNVLIADYEYAQTLPLMRPQWELVPEAIPAEACHTRQDHVLKYPGIKEDVYAWTLKPDASILAELQIQPDHLVIVVRPPATEAHYHNPESEPLFGTVMDYCLADPRARIILLPRNRKQLEWVQGRWPSWFNANRVVVPAKAVDGLNLLWHSDLVISGGGTMNREAAALGVPVYSIFRGPTGSVDRALEREGRLIMIRNSDDVPEKIRLQPRNKVVSLPLTRGPALSSILDHIDHIAGQGRSA